MGVLATLEVYKAAPDGYTLLKQPECPVLLTAMNGGFGLEFESCRFSVRP